MANLNLTADQKTKMDALMTEHAKAGCTKENEEKYMEEAKGVLTPISSPSSRPNAKARKRRARPNRRIQFNQRFAPRVISARFAYPISSPSQLTRTNRRALDSIPQGVYDEC